MTDSNRPVLDGAGQIRASALHIRVGRAEKAEMHAFLRECYALEYLDDGEFQQRMQAVFAAKTWGDFYQISGDLPATLDAPKLVLPPSPRLKRKMGRALAVTWGTTWRLLLTVMFANIWLPWRVFTTEFSSSAQPGWLDDLCGISVIVRAFVAALCLVWAICWTTDGVIGS